MHEFGVIVVCVIGFLVYVLFGGALMEHLENEHDISQNWFTIMIWPIFAMGYLSYLLARLIIWGLGRIWKGWSPPPAIDK